MDSICEGLKSFWEQASEGTLPLLFPAWLTNAAYEAMKRICKRIEDVEQDIQEHSDIYTRLVTKPGLVFTSCPIESKFDYFTSGREIRIPWVSTILFKSKWMKGEDIFGPVERQDPIECITSMHYKDEVDSVQGKEIATC